MIRDLVHLFIAPDLSAGWRVAWLVVFTALGLIVVGTGFGVIWAALDRAFDYAIAARRHRDESIFRDHAKPRQPFTSDARRVR